MEKMPSKDWMKPVLGSVFVPKSALKIQKATCYDNLLIIQFLFICDEQIMENMDSRMQAFEESTGVNISEIEENENELAAFEDQIAKDRNEGLFFKNLTQGKPKEKVNATEEIKKIKELTKKSAGSETRRNIYLVLIGLLLIEIVDSFITSTPDWRKVAILGVILVGLVTQFIYEQKMLSEKEIAEEKKTEEERR